MDLPSVIPLFPLPNVVLFPGVPLPLHIFEPRYREMVRDAKDAQNLIGMTLLRGEWQADYYGAPQIYAVGCAGRMVSCEALPDGRYNILLHGQREFLVEREIDGKPYRQSVVRWLPATPADAALPPGLRERLAANLRACAGLHLEAAARKLIDDPTLGDTLLVNFFSYALDVPAVEKQSLLEAAPLAARAERLAEVIEFHLHEARSGFGGTAPGPVRTH